MSNTNSTDGSNRREMNLGQNRELAIQKAIVLAKDSKDPLWLFTEAGQWWLNLEQPLFQDGRAKCFKVTKKGAKHAHFIYTL